MRALLVAGAAVLLLGCGGKKPATGASGARVAEMTEEELFRRGSELLEARKLDDARSHLRRYEQRYPRGPHIEEVKLLLADSYFRASTPEQQVEGVAQYRQVLTMYPRSPVACKAQLRIAEYHLKQMRSCERDQSETRQAVDELQKLLALYPDCADAAQAREQLAAAYDRLACAEMRVAQYYERTGKLVSAEHRLRDLLRDYARFAERCRALALYIKVLEQRGDLETARAELGRMEEECPADKLLEEARRRLRVTPKIEGAAETGQGGGEK